MAKTVGLSKVIPVKAWRPGREPLENIHLNSKINIDAIKLSSRIDREVLLESRIEAK